MKIKLKTFATYVAISFFFASFFSLLITVIFYEKINYYISLINTTAVKEFSVEKEIVYNKEANMLLDYPDYGKKYANLIIPSIDMNLPVFHGDNLTILKSAVGHYAGSYFPGEGGTVLLAAHNTKGFFQRIEELKIGDDITIETTYGIFKYKVENMKVVKETDLDAFPFQKERELLIMYTCYPINRSIVGRKTERYVVYAYRVGDNNE